MKNIFLLPIATLLTHPLAFAQSSNTVKVESPAVALDMPISVATPKTNKVELTYVAESSSPTRATNLGDGRSFKSEQHIGFAQALSLTRKIQFRQYFLYNMSNYKQDNEWDLGDHAIQYNDVQAFRIGDEVGTFLARLYIPGSDYSRAVGKYEIRVYGEVEQALPNRFSVTYTLNPRAYLNSGKADGQPAFRIFPAVYFNYNRNLKLVPFAGVYTEHTWRHTGTNITSDMKPQESKSSSVNYDAAFYSAGVRTQPAKDLKVSLYTETEDSLRDGKSVEAFDDDTTVYYLDLAISM